MSNCRNTLRICAFFEECGELVKPCPQDEIHIKVESCSQKRFYSLNNDNCYCVTLEGLGNETFCVSTSDCDFDVTFEVDGCCCDDACVNFDDRNFHRMRIILREPTRYGNLQLHKKVFDTCGREVMCDDCFKIRIRNDEREKTIILNEDNCFETRIENMPFGQYEICEENNEDFDVCFIVDGKKTNKGIFCIDSECNHVEIINHFNNGPHFLRVCKWTCCNGKLIKPEFDECFDIRVSGGEKACREYTLKCENRFCMTLEGCRDDVLELNLIDPCSNTIYEVDGVEMEKVCVKMNEDHDIRIISLNDNCCCDECRNCNNDCNFNPRCCDDDCCYNYHRENNCESRCRCCEDDNSCNCGGFKGSSLTISKWIEAQGKRCKPNKNDMFRIRVQGYRDRCFELCQRNDFTLVLDDIRSGYYCIYEDQNDDYDVKFDVNGKIQKDGYLFVNTNEDSEVQIINRKRCEDQEEEMENYLCIAKRVSDENECADATVMVPTSGRFEIVVESANGKEQYVLCEENQYEMKLPVKNGEYMIKEMNASCSVTYQVDGKNMKNNAKVMINNASSEVVIINHLNRVNYVI